MCEFYLSACLASGKSSPSNDFCKKLGTFLGPRLSQIAREIRDFVGKSKTIRYIRWHLPSTARLISSLGLDTSIYWTLHITASEITVTLSVHQYSDYRGFMSHINMFFHEVCSPSHSSEQQYKYVYFNEMNLAVKSYLSSRRTMSPLQHITPEAMRLIIDLNAEYNE